MTTADLRVLGLAQRAGFVAAGEDTVLTSISSKTARLVLLSNDLGGAAARRVKETAFKNNIPCLKLNVAMDELGFAIGRRKTGVVAIEDMGLAALFADKMRSESEENEKIAALLSEKAERFIKRKKAKNAKSVSIKTGKRRTE